MSLLTRQGTMVRKNRNSIKRSIRRKPNPTKRETSGPSATSQSTGTQSTMPGVHREYRPSPARSVASTVVVGLSLALPFVDFINLHQFSVDEFYWLWRYMLTKVKNCVKMSFYRYSNGKDSKERRVSLIYCFFYMWIQISKFNCRGIYAMLIWLGWGSTMEPKWIN